MVRLIEHSVPVKVELDLKVQFYDNARGFNIIGEIPGTDLASEVVTLGRISTRIRSRPARPTTRPARRRCSRRSASSRRSA